MLRVLTEEDMELLQDIEDQSHEFPMLGRASGDVTDVIGEESGREAAGSSESSEDEDDEDTETSGTQTIGRGTTEGAEMPDMSILQKVRDRIYGGGVAETTQMDTISFSESSLAKPVEESVPTFHRLPQLGVEDADVEDQTGLAETQKIAHNSIPDTQVIRQDKVGETKGSDVGEDREVFAETQPLSEEARNLKIKELAERKRQERLEQEKDLIADITHTTLTDEEEDMNAEYNDTVVSSKQTDAVSKKELEEAEMFLNVQKRDIDLQPEFESKKIFTKARLLSEFDMDDDEDEDDIKDGPKLASNSDSPLDLAARNSSPVTSPVQSTSKRSPSPSSDSEEEMDILDIINADPKKRESEKVDKTADPITSYAHNLKRKIVKKGPGASENGGNLISLDSESEDDDMMHNQLGSDRSRRVSDIDVPKLSKEEMLTIKQKYSRKKLKEESEVVSKLPKSMRNSMFKNSSGKEAKNLLVELRKANTAQLRGQKATGPNNEIIEDIEKDEEIMGNLLEREFERARNIRKKEKLRERAAMALLGASKDSKDADEGEAGNESEEVPDSDINSVVDSDYDSNSSNESEDKDKEDGDDDEISVMKGDVKRKRKQFVLSDDSDDDISHENSQEIASSKHLIAQNMKDSLREHGYSRNDDSYMFGSDPVDHEYSLNHDEFITTINTQTVKDIFGKGASLSQDYKQSLQTMPNDASGPNNLEVQNSSIISEPTTQQLFKNLPPGNESTSSLDHASPERSQNEMDNLAVPSFQSLPDLSTQQASQYATQQDTQQDSISTQVDDIGQSERNSYKHDTDNDNLEDEDDDITPNNLKNSKKLIAKNKILGDIEEEGDEEDEADNIKERIKLYEEKIRRKELRMRKKRKELERKGVRNMVEGEAEESEDEWKGLGGVDDDFSDEQANSDDEKMIDNDFNLDLNNEAVRKKFMEQYQIKDQKDLEKLLDDIKNHRLSKRAAGNGFDIELSDEEDELLMRYRNQKLKEQKERLMANKKLQELSKDEKSRAFFDSIQDLAPVINIDDDHDDDDVIDERPDSNDKNKDPFSDLTNKNDDDGNEEELDELEKEEPVKKSVKIEQSFVQRQLSFLNKDSDHDYNNIQRLSNLQHGVTASDEEVDDLQVLKTKSLSNLNVKKSQLFDAATDIDLTAKRSLESETDSDDEFLPLLKKPSIISSFRSQNVQSSNSFSGVTISKQYKVAVASKASITYMSSHKKQVKSLKERQIEKSLSKESAISRKLSDSTGFDN